VLPPNAFAVDVQVPARVILVLATLWTAWASLGGPVHHRSLVAAVNGGAAQVVEGPVVNFRPMPSGGHGTEQIDVAGRHFEYAESIDTGAFNRTGLLSDGQTVRITHLGDEILTLEIASPR
jgi:hypothetical protein